MIRLWHRLLASLTPGVRGLLALLATAYLTAVIGKLTHTCTLYSDLGLSGPAFRSGQVWRLVTYVLLPVSILDFVMNGLMLFVLGGLLERNWSRYDLWIYCALVAAGSGLAQVTIYHADPVSLVGAAPLAFGFLVAWGYLFGHERFLMLGVGEISVRFLAALAALITFVTTWLSAGLVNALILIAGGLIGLLYLWSHQALLMTRQSRMVHSERINRLEL